MRPGTLGRLALAGTRTDAVRVVLTALSAALAALAGLAALTVLAIPTPPATDDNEVRWSLQYATALLREPGLRGGTAFALLLLALPVLALAGQCARLGAPARDRRLAAFRLAGATPGQVTRLAALETGVASLLGAVGGLVVFLIAHELLDRPGADGRLALPTDVLPSPVALAATVLGLPAVAAAATALLLRRVVTTPFGVVRRARRDRPPRPWFALLVPAGVGSIAGYFPLLHWLERHEVQAPLPYLPILVAVGGLAALVGTVLAAGWFSYAAGRLLHRLAQGPAALLAARRLAADPWAGSRTFAALLAAVLFGGGAAAFRAHFQARYAAELAEARTFGDVTSAGDTFYLDTIGLVDLAVAAAVTIAAGGLLVALVEGIVARRRAYAALVAQGVPRGVLGRSVAWQALAPAVPAVLLALTVGLLLGRLFSGPIRTGGSGYVCEAAAAICADPAARGPYLRLIEAPERFAMPGVPLEELALVGAGAVAAVALTVAVGLLFLRASTTVEELRAT